ncbi:hypothetical protein HGRIS_005615 [Hohenbuehelia grisea]|uniref:EF-hand domain-containing protein n=1 Tax=Hohenbuehelia grisea TaxID=104357 RepID=A0ABR3JZP2_9AGAR
MRRLGRNLSDSQLQVILKEIDLNKSGVIEFSEFLGVMAYELSDPDRELLETFKGFDQNGDGFVTPEELKQVMSSIGERLTDDEVDTMIRESDSDKDGRVNYEEFVKVREPLPTMTEQDLTS